MKKFLITKCMNYIKRNNDYSDTKLKEIEYGLVSIYLTLTKPDPSIDKIHLDLAICTSTNTKDMKIVEDIYNFCNTDLPYSGKLPDDKYAVRVHGENRATARTVNEIKSLIG